MKPNFVLYFVGLCAGGGSLAHSFLRLILKENTRADHEYMIIDPPPIHAIFMDLS